GINYKRCAHKMSNNLCRIMRHMGDRCNPGTSGAPLQGEQGLLLGEPSGTAEAPQAAGSDHPVTGDAQAHALPPHRISAPARPPAGAPPPPATPATRAAPPGASPGPPG